MQDIFTSGSDIVIVDDEANNLSVLKGILENRGHHIRPALSGELALKAIRRRSPDLVLLDILMPGADGYEICAELKAAPATRDIPILFISALSETQDKVKAFESGGLDYISKPFRAEEVVARVEAHLGLRRMSKALAEQNELLRLEIEERKKAQNALAMANRELEKLAHLDGLTMVRTGVFLSRPWQRSGSGRSAMPRPWRCYWRT